jgi:hypothetical protein
MAKKKVEIQPTPKTILVTERRPWREFIERHHVLLVGILILIASVRIAATYSVYSHTSDEPAHIACGVEWLEKGIYHYEAQHPPLARVAVALGPYLMGERGYGDSNMLREGAKILFLRGHYDRNMILSRLAILPFFWVAAISVYFWAKKDFGPFHAVITIFLFTFLPAILAHAGLATTDMPLTAFVGASFVSGMACFEKPSLRRGLLFGVCTALAVISKFSSLPYLGGAFAAAGLVWFLQKRCIPWGALPERVKPLWAGLAILPLIVWAMYRFDFGYSAVLGMRVPAPELFEGIKEVAHHNATGHPAYLLGMESTSGWWYYYLVVLAVKTPLPFLALLGIGIVIAWNAARRGSFAFALPMAFSFSILAFAMSAHINIGVRHILPVYMGFSILSAAAVVRLLEMAPLVTGAKWALAILLLWMAGTSLASHPDYLPYFNALAGSEPERIVVDSDLDWGQDVKRLAERLREVGAPSVAFNPFTIVNFELQGFPSVRALDLQHPSPGWTAISLTSLKSAHLGHLPLEPGVPLWPDLIKPTEHVGKGIALWYFPPGYFPPERPH